MRFHRVPANRLAAAVALFNIAALALLVLIQSNALIGALLILAELMIALGLRLFHPSSASDMLRGILWTPLVLLFGMSVYLVFMLIMVAATFGDWP